jgi:hypothetical protein
MIMKLINESVYWQGTVKSVVVLNRHLQEVLGCEPGIIILMILLYNLKYIPTVEELLQEDTINCILE